MTSFRSSSNISYFYFLFFVYRVMSSAKSPPCIGSWIPSMQICRLLHVSNLTSCAMPYGRQLMRRLHWKIVTFTATIRIWAQIRTANQVACGHSITSSTTKKWSGLSSLRAKHSSKFDTIFNLSGNRHNPDKIIKFLSYLYVFWYKLRHSSNFSKRRA